MLIETDSRIAFGLEWYDDFEEAMKRASDVKDESFKYGRDPSMDKVSDDGTELFAVAVP